jgi:hypothetical protein
MSDISVCRCDDCICISKEMKSGEWNSVQLSHEEFNEVLRKVGMMK